MLPLHRRLFCFIVPYDAEKPYFSYYAWLISNRQFGCSLVLVSVQTSVWLKFQCSQSNCSHNKIPTGTTAELKLEPNCDWTAVLKAVFFIMYQIDRNAHVSLTSSLVSSAFRIFHLGPGRSYCANSTGNSHGIPSLHLQWQWMSRVLRNYIVLSGRLTIENFVFPCSQRY